MKIKKNKSIIIYRIHENQKKGKNKKLNIYHITGS